MKLTASRGVCSLAEKAATSKPWRNITPAKTVKFRFLATCLSSFGGTRLEQLSDMSADSDHGVTADTLRAVATLCLQSVHAYWLLQGAINAFLQLARPLLCYVRKDRTIAHWETHMNAITSKLTALAAALVMNSLIMGAVGYLFEIQLHPTMSAVSFAKAVVTHQWLI